MSTEQVDPELVEQTKQQIRNIVREIAQLSKSDLAPTEFYDAFLNRLVEALAAVGGAVWTIGEGGRLELEYQINLRETRLAESQDNQALHGRLLRRAMAAPEGMLVAPHSGSVDEKDGGNPTDFLLVLGALRTDQEPRGIVEIFQRAGAGANVQRGYLRFLLQMCELASDYLKTRQLRHFTDRQTLWAQLESFTRVAHRSLDPKSTAYTIANEGRRLIECDRVSVGICRGKKCIIEAVSGQDTFDKRSNTVTLLGKLATAVVATGETVWYTGDTTYMAPQVEEAVQNYVDESHSKTVAVIPLKRPQDDAEALLKRQEPNEVIAALIIEQIEDSRPKEGLPQRVEVVSEHSATALANALEYHGLFLLPVWQSLGRATWVLKARTLPKTLAITGAVLGLLLFLAICPWKFALEGKGTLQPVEKRDVFAGIEGVVEEIFVKHGEVVKKGQVLAKMRNTELGVKIEELIGQLAANQEQINSIRRGLNEEKRSTPEERNRLEGELAKAIQTAISFDKQLQLERLKQQELQIKSPLDGEVITWQVKELLIHRPVQKGQILMTVADPTKDWELEVHVPEDRMGHVAQALRKRRELAREQGIPLEPLQVAYIMATSPGAEHEGTVKEVHRGAEVRGDEGNTVLVKVSIDKKDLTELQIGAGATAKVNCGRAPLGYVLFRDALAFAQKGLFKIF